MREDIEEREEGLTEEAIREQIKVAHKHRTKRLQKVDRLGVKRAGVEVVDEEEGSADCDLSKSRFREMRVGFKGIRIGSKKKGKVNGTLESEEVNTGMEHSLQTDALNMKSGVWRFLFAEEGLEEEKNREDDKTPESEEQGVTSEGIWLGSGDCSEDTRDSEYEEVVGETLAVVTEARLTLERSSKGKPQEEEAYRDGTIEDRIGQEEGRALHYFWSKKEDSAAYY